MYVSGRYFPELLMLEQIDVHCQMAEHAFQWLEAGLDSGRNRERDQGTSDPNPSHRFEIYRNAQSFLTNVAIVSRFLFVGHRLDHMKSEKRKKHPRTKRCARLRRLAGIKVGDFPLLRNLGLRNDFEHVDERFDAHFDKNWTVAGMSYDQMRIGREGQPTDRSETPHFTLIRVDPDSWDICFFENNDFNAKEALDEIKVVAERVRAARNKLHPGSRAKPLVEIVEKR